MNIYQQRLHQLQELLRKNGHRLAIVSFSDHMRYLSGYWEHGHKRLLALFVPSTGSPAFVVPQMNCEQALHNPAGITRVLGWEDCNGWIETVRALFEEWGLAPGDTILVDDELYAVHLIGIQQLAPSSQYLPADPLLAQLRQVKSSEELAAMQSAAEIIDNVMEDTLHYLREGIQEIEVAERVLALIRQHGSSPSFDPLICFGANAAMPHHTPDTTALQRGDIVLLDMGCRWQHYASDITRTFSYGPPKNALAEEVYSVVAQAHYAALLTVKPGTTCEQVDRAARQVIERAGYGKFFIHRTGHGIGLSCHEPPYIQEGNTLPLQPGYCFSIEPGIYLSQQFGVRLENIVTVEQDGARSLNRPIPKALPIL